RVLNGTKFDYTYDGSCRITSVSKVGVKIEDNLFNYAGDRVRKIYYNPSGGTITTYYVSGRYELRQNSTTPTSYTRTKHVESPGAGKLVSITTNQTGMLAELERREQKYAFASVLDFAGRNS